MEYESASTQNVHRATSRRRFSAAILDVALILPVTLVLCAGGSFETESTHENYSILYILAGGWPLIYSFLEVLTGATLGMSIVGIKIVDASNKNALRQARLKRWIWKYGALILVWLFLTSFSVMGHGKGSFIRDEVLGFLLWFVVIVWMLYSVRALERKQAWFDRRAGTTIIQIKRVSSEVSENEDYSD
ncbi:MAG TPA: RDD family protein [Tepidisphaeraceae bacterium]|jgi:uncharacterized RDD family membrane protein YckC|nr:RDD family protein [Tepidisphaeraceae bacterium]